MEHQQGCVLMLAQGGTHMAMLHPLASCAGARVAAPRAVVLLCISIPCMLT